MMIDGRLSDALNKREPIEIVDVQWAPIDGSEPMVAAPGLKTVDPYDLVLVLAGDDSLPELTEDGKAAHRVHKVSYEVALEVPPYRVIGTVYLYPGSEPEQPARPVDGDVRPDRRRDGRDGRQPGRRPRPRRPSWSTASTCAASSRSTSRTGERHEKLPGAPLGGTNWTDRA